MKNMEQVSVKPECFTREDKGAQAWPRGSSLRREMKAEASLAKIKKIVKADSALPGQERACRGLAQALPQQLQHNNTEGSPTWKGEGP